MDFIGDTRDTILDRAKASCDPTYFERIRYITLCQAGYNDAEAKAGMNVTPYLSAWEPAVYDSVALASPRDGVSNKLAQDAKILTMALSSWKPEITIEGADPMTKAVITAWFNQIIWPQTQFKEKLMEINSDMHLGLAIGAIGLDQEGKPNWTRYSLLKCLTDPMYRRPDDWRYGFLMDEYDLDEASDRFGVARKELEGLAHKKQIFTKWDAGGTGYYLPNVVRVYRYWSRPRWKQGKFMKGSQCIIIGSLSNTNAVWMTLDDDNQYKRMQKYAGESPYKSLPIKGGYEMLIPDVKNPVGRAQWEVPLSQQFQKIMTSIMQGVEDGAGMRIFSSMGFDEDLIEKLANGDKLLDAKSRVFVAEHMQDIRNAFMDVPPYQIPQDRMMLAGWLQQQMNESSGTTDAQHNRSTGGEKTATQVTIEQDQGGIQSQHANAREGQFIIDVVQGLKECAANYDDREYMLDIGDGFMINTKTQPIQPFLRKEVVIGVTEDSMAHMGAAQKALISAQRFQQVEMLGIQLGVVDAPTAFANLAKDVYGAIDPKTRGILTTQEFAAKQAAAAKAQQDAAERQALLEKGLAPRIAQAGQDQQGG